jgi:hypothetical protein
MGQAVEGKGKSPAFVATFHPYEKVARIAKGRTGMRVFAARRKGADQQTQPTVQQTTASSSYVR